jgi:putative MATE family efflux protein
LSKVATDFTQGKILGPLVKFAIPLFGALFLQAAYGAVDLLVVGIFGDSTGISAVGIGSQIMMFVTGAIAGLGAGTMISLSQFIGAGDDEKSAGIVGCSIVVFAVVTVVVTLILVFLPTQLVQLMDAPPESFDKAVQYVFVCGIGTIAIVCYNLVSNIIRACGNANLPLVFVAVACVANVVLDLVLIGALGMDSLGAAIATVSAQGISVVVSLIVIKHTGLPFKFERRHLRPRAMLVKRMLRLGFPVALQDMLTNITFLMIFAIVNGMGLTESAALGIGEKVCVFIMLVPMAFMQAVGTFSAQNVGAAKLDRAKKSLRYGIEVSFCIGVLMFVLAFWFGDVLAGIFSSEPDVVANAALYLKAYAIDCMLVCVLFNMLGFFNGCGCTTFVMVQGLVQAFCVRLPAAIFFSQLPNTSLFYIGLAYPLASIVGITICLVFYKTGRWKKRTVEFERKDGTESAQLP